MSQDHVLVTGGAGFLGSHIVDTLIDRGFRVTVLDCLLPQVHANAKLDAFGWPAYLNSKARRIKGSLLDDGLFEHSLNGISHLVHMAASVGVGQSMENIFDYTRNNTMAAALMLDVLSRGEHQVRRIAVASSMSIYGEGAYQSMLDRRPIMPRPRTIEQLRRGEWELMHDGKTLEPVPTSEDKPLQPASIYAINKRDQEEMFIAVGRALNIPTVALRLFNAYGSRQSLANPYTGVAAIFISRLLGDQPPLIFEDGEQKRDFVHAFDVANAFATVLTDEKRVWEAFNFGSGQSITIRQIAIILGCMLGKQIAPKFLHQYRVGDIRHCFSDNTKIETTFGIRPRFRIEDGMTELIRWVQEVRQPVDPYENGERGSVQSEGSPRH